MDEPGGCNVEFRGEKIKNVEGNAFMESILGVQDIGIAIHLKR